jgi:hypothetical protein
VAISPSVLFYAWESTIWHDPAVSTERRGLWVLTISGLLGFRVGIVGFPDWQVAVETSQVVAGLVTYPAGNPFFVYHTKLWTVLHQICAVLLLSGVSEIRLSLILSGVLGMVTFQALSIFVYALSRDALLAIGAAVLIYFTRSAEYGAVYGLFLMGTENTYGVVGLSFCVLAVALIGAGWYRAGGMLLGVAPAVHPSLGVWIGAVVALAFLSDFKRLREELRPGFRWFLAGCGLTVLSLLVQLAFTYRAPPLDAAFSTREVSAFITFWDGHRKPVDIANNGVLLNFGALAIALIWLLAFVEDLTRSSIFLLRVVVVSALLSIGLVFVSWIPPERLPTTLLVLMPGRVLNFNALISVALVVGLLGNYRRLWSRLLLLGLFCGLLAGDHSMLWEWLQQRRGIVFESHVHPLWIVTAVSVALVLGAAVNRLRQGYGGPALRTAPYVRAMSLAVLLMATVFTLGFSQPRSLIFRDRTNDVFFGQVAAGKGLLLTAGDLHLIQLRTRRPVLLDGGGLDGVMYSLEAGPAMARILRDVYGVDLLNPPEEARGAGRIPPLANQKTWQAYSPEKWRAIGRAYHVTQVLTYADWMLNLPLVAQSRRMLLYQIPD